MRIHTINEVPIYNPIHNPFVGIIWETSLVPEIILSEGYKEKVMEWTRDEKMFEERGSLIGWFYLRDIMPSKEEYMELVHIAAKNGYYKDLKL